MPVRFDDPRPGDHERFAVLMRSLGQRKVLVRCHINMRAPAFVLLYRVTELHEHPCAAWPDMARVWTPEGSWRWMMEGALRKNGVAFEIL